VPELTVRALALVSLRHRIVWTRRFVPMSPPPPLVRAAAHCSAGGRSSGCFRRLEDDGRQAWRRAAGPVRQAGRPARMGLTLGLTLSEARRNDGLVGCLGRRGRRPPSRPRPSVSAHNETGRRLSRVRFSLGHARLRRERAFKTKALRSAAILRTKRYTWATPRHTHTTPRREHTSRPATFGRSGPDALRLAGLWK
jgi:hypothetical protein